MPKTPTTRIYNVDLTLKADQVEALLALPIVGGGAAEQTDAHRIGGIALGLLEKLAEGGLMLTTDELARITDATGVDPECGEDLVAVLGEATGMEEGYHCIKVKIDPAWWELYKQPAEIQGRTPEELIQEVVDSTLDNDPFQYFGMGGPRIIRMTEDDAKALEEILGGKFQTGTDLAKLIRQMLGVPFEEDAPVAALPEPGAVSQVGREEAD